MTSCMKRALAVLLAAIMTLSLVACGGDKEEASKADIPVEPEIEEVNNAEHPNWLCNEKTTLTVTTYDGVSTNYDPPNNDDPFWAWLEEETNVHIEWEVIPYAGYNEVIQTRLASGEDMGDIVMVYNIDNGQAAGRNGLLLDLAPYWDTYFTHTQAYSEKAGTDYKGLVTNGSGEIYTINGTQEPVEGHRVIMYNTAWMKELGLEIPTTLEEFENVLYTMKAAGDINGNGKDDEVILSSNGLLSMNAIMGNAFGLENYVYWNAFQADENGKVFHEDSSDNMRAMLTFENQLYEDGILDAEINSMTNNILSEKIAADRVGVFIYYSAFSFSYGGLTTAGQADPYGEHYTMGGPLASEWNDNEGYFVRWEKASSVPTGVRADSEHAALAMRWLDFMFGSEEAVLRRTLGIEGKDYKKNADGSIEYIYPTDGSEWYGSGKNCGQIALAFNQTRDQLLVTKNDYPWYLEQYDYLRDECKWISPSVPAINYYSAEEQEVIDMFKADFKSYNDEMQAKFVNGEADIDTEWDTFVTTLGKLGLEELTAVHQSVYDRIRG